MSKRTVKNFKGEQHKSAANLQTKGEMGAELYQQNVVNVTPIFRGIVKMKKKDRDSRRINFYSAYYLAKMERAFSDYNNLLKLQIKTKVTGIKPKYKSLNQAALFMDYIGGGMKKSLAESVAYARYFACSVMEALTAQSQSKRSFMFCFYTMVYLLSNKSA